MQIIDKWKSEIKNFPFHLKGEQMVEQVSSSVNFVLE